MTEAVLTFTWFRCMFILSVYRNVKHSPFQNLKVTLNGLRNLRALECLEIFAYSLKKIFIQQNRNTLERESIRVKIKSVKFYGTQ